MPASIPIKHRGTLASRAALRPRASFSRKTIAPFSSRPIKCRVFLPVSMPMVGATVAAVLWDIWRYAPRASKPLAHSLSGCRPEHGRSIPFSEVGDAPKILNWTGPDVFEASSLDSYNDAFDPFWCGHAATRVHRCH